MGNRRYSIVDAAGLPVEEMNTVFPLFKEKKSDLLEGLGTGFFINEGGLFLTAAHVVLAHDFQSDEKLIAIHKIHGEDGFVPRPVVRAVAHRKTDIAICVAEPVSYTDTGRPILNQKVGLTDRVPRIGEPVLSFGFPLTTVTPVLPDIGQQAAFLEPFWTSGHIEEYFPNGRDRIMQPGPCFQTSLEAHSGGSGSPVVNNDGYAFGVISSSMEDHTTFVAPIYELLDLLMFEDVDTGEVCRLRDLATVR